jgi:hypothetical protein
LSVVSCQLFVVLSWDVMPGAKVDSIQVIGDFKVALVKFQEYANAALADAEGDLNRTLMWLQTEALFHWQTQARKRKDKVEQCREKVREKRNYVNPITKQPQSAVDEEKALKVAMRRLEEAEARLANVKKYGRVLEKATMDYKGAVQRFTTAVTADIPAACALLENVLRQLASYTALNPELTEVVSETTGDSGGASMARAAGGPGDVSPADLAHGLRERTPDASARLLAPPGAVPAGKWKVRGLERWERERLAKIAGVPFGEVTEPAVAPAGTVILAPGAAAAVRLYAERVPRDSEDETGWYLAPADFTPPGESVRVKLAEVLAVRPDLEEALALPEGTLFVLGLHGVETVLNREHEDLWSTEPAKG